MSLKTKRGVLSTRKIMIHLIWRLHAESVPIVIGEVLVRIKPNKIIGEKNVAGWD
jgi:hypothetical protein